MQKAGTIKLNNSTLTNVEEAICLGVSFDKQLTWKPHIVHSDARARKKISILRKLAGTTYGASKNILKQYFRVQSGPISNMAHQR